MLDLRVNSLPLSLCGPLYTAREAHEAPLGLGMGWLHSITAWRQCEGPRLLGLCISPHTEKNRNLQLWLFRCVSFVTTQMLS